MVAMRFVLVLSLAMGAFGHTVPLTKVKVTDYGLHGYIPHKRTEVKKSAPSQGHNLHRRSSGSERALLPLSLEDDSGEDLAKSASAYEGYRHNFGGFHSFLPYPPHNHGPHPGAYPPPFGHQQYGFPGNGNDGWGAPCHGYGCGRGPSNGYGHGQGHGHGRGFGNGQGHGHGHGNGQGHGFGHGNGNGHGHGNGNGHGHGNGNGHGHGNGNGQGHGNPYPPSANPCQEFGPGNGHGQGHAYGHGNGNGHGNGHGHAYGNKHKHDFDDDDYNCDHDNGSDEDYSTENMPIIVPTTEKATHPPVVLTTEKVTYPPVVLTTEKVTYPPVVLTTEKITPAPPPTSTEFPIYDIDVRLGEAGRK